LHYSILTSCILCSQLVALSAAGLVLHLLTVQWFNTAAAAAAAASAAAAITFSFV